MTGDISSLPTSLTLAVLLLNRRRPPSPLSVLVVVLRSLLLLQHTRRPPLRWRLRPVLLRPMSLLSRPPPACRPSCPILSTNSPRCHQFSRQTYQVYLLALVGTICDELLEQFIRGLGRSLSS